MHAEVLVSQRSDVFWDTALLVSDNDYNNGTYLPATIGFSYYLQNVDTCVFD